MTLIPEQIWKGCLSDEVARKVRALEVAYGWEFSAGQDQIFGDMPPELRAKVSVVVGWRAPDGALLPVRVSDEIGYLDAASEGDGEGLDEAFESLFSKLSGKPVSAFRRFTAGSLGHCVYGTQASWNVPEFRSAGELALKLAAEGSV